MWDDVFVEYYLDSNYNIIDKHETFRVSEKCSQTKIIIIKHSQRYLDLKTSSFFRSILKVKEEIHNQETWPAII